MGQLPRQLLTGSSYSRTGPSGGTMRPGKLLVKEIAPFSLLLIQQNRTYIEHILNIPHILLSSLGMDVSSIPFFVRCLPGQSCAAVPHSLVGCTGCLSQKKQGKGRVTSLANPAHLPGFTVRGSAKDNLGLLRENLDSRWIRN